MAEFGAKDVKALRDATGAGMMDAKRALEENGGDFETAAKWLREQGIVKSAARADRENTQGAVDVAKDGNFYGATVTGGLPPEFSYSNVIFRLTATGVLTTVVAFNRGSDPGTVSVSTSVW